MAVLLHWYRTPCLALLLWAASTGGKQMIFSIYVQQDLITAALSSCSAATTWYRSRWWYSCMRFRSCGLRPRAADMGGSTGLSEVHLHLLPARHPSVTSSCCTPPCSAAPLRARADRLHDRQSTALRFSPSTPRPIVAAVLSRLATALGGIWIYACGRFITVGELPVGKSPAPSSRSATWWRSR